MSDVTYVKERPQNATATIKGIVRLAGDLGGTADAPTVVHISPSVTVGLVSGGTGADLSATGPGLLVQASGGANVTVTTTPALGTPSAAVLTNATGLPTAGLVDAAVTLAKMANLAQDQFIGRTTASTGVPETATITAAARTVLDDTTVAGMVDTLGGASATGSGGLVRTTSPIITTDITIPNTGLHLLDTNASHDLIIAPGSNLTADRTLTVTTGDANRTLTMTGDAVLNQDVSTMGTPTLGQVTITPATNIYALRLIQDNADYGFSLKNDSSTGNLDLLRYALGSDGSIFFSVTSDGQVGIGTTAASGYRFDIDAGAMRLAEMTAPAAPAANGVVIYAQDNGAGKTQLMALFSSGAAQQIAIQP